ncbi:MAG: LVIVD repeat-containing protein [Paludibacteraceae bacterium]
MKPIYYLFLLSLFIMGACADLVEQTITYKINEPVFMPADQFRSLVKVLQTPKEIRKSGKIVFYNGYLYISEPEKGIHIIDNRNPAQPLNTGFIELPGNADLAVKDSILYADSYIDLVWFDISGSEPELLGRLEDVFPNSVPAVDNNYKCDIEKSMDKSNGIVVGWKIGERTETYLQQRNFWWRDKGDFLSTVANGNEALAGKTGSLSRFAVYGNFLYTVMNDRLGIFNIEVPAPVKAGNNSTVGWNVETIFNYKNYLYLGTPTGMMIYSVSNPVKPEYLSSIPSVMGCNPVTVENDVAYVTIHSGNRCGQNTNQLLIYSVADPKQPNQLISYEMKNPGGLGIENGTLFVIDKGLKVFNAQSPLTMMESSNKLAYYSNFDGYDLILYQKILMMIAGDGLYQYDYSDLNTIKQISRIPINN